MALTQETANEVISHALEMAKGIKEQVLEHADNPVAGIPPMLLIGHGDNIEDGGGIVQLDIEGINNPADILPQVLSDLNNDGHLQKWSWLCLIVEAYIDSRIGIDENYERGDAEKEYKENPFTTVKETMVANIYTYDFQQFGAYQVFSLDDAGKPVYDEVQFQDEGSDNGGLIPFIFRSFTEWCHIQEIKKQADNN
jgi:hypothetical protein